MHTLTFRTLPRASSKGINVHAEAVVAGTAHVTAGLRAEDVPAFQAAWDAANAPDAAVRVVRYKDYEGCFSADLRIGVPARASGGAYLCGRMLSWYSQEAVGAGARAGWQLEETGSALTSHYEVPAPVRAVDAGDTFRAERVLPDGTVAESVLLRVVRTGRTWNVEVVPA